MVLTVAETASALGVEAIVGLALAVRPAWRQIRRYRAENREAHRNLASLRSATAGRQESLRRSAATLRHPGVIDPCGWSTGGYSTFRPEPSRPPQQHRRRRTR